MRRSWLAAGAVVALYVLLGWLLGRDAGVTRTVAVDAGRDELAVERVRSVDLQGLAPGILQRADIVVTWRGAWRVPASGLYELALASHGRSEWRIDGHLAQQAAGPSDNGVRRAVWLAAGFHPIEITYEPAGGGAPLISAAAARPREALSPIDPRALKPRLPRNPSLRWAGDLACRALFWFGLVAIAFAVRKSAPAIIAPVGARLNRLQRDGQAHRVIAWLVLAVILIHGALLRIDAITARFGVVASPSWVADVQTRTIAAPEAIRPSSMTWDPAPLFPHADGPPTRYLSDPYTYLQAARQERSFYGAHYREPVFPYAVRIALTLFNNQDVAVSFASTAFSVLAIWLAYLLGAAVWSRPVGLLAATGFALDYDAITLASLGWRDDAFVAAVALGAYLMLRCWRAGRVEPRVVRIGPWHVDAAYLESIALGVVAGLVVLVRIMAVSFLVCGAAWLVLTMRAHWRRRLAMAGLGVVTATLVAGPYFVNCWRVYGDPLYTFNVHGDVYRVAEGGAATSEDTMSYILRKAVARPFQMIDTVASGLTTYPFSNKWSGLNHWWPQAGRWASLASLAGLIVLAASSQGRLLLLIMVTSLVPFAFTWKVDPNWRFTVHVYPVLLIAAAVGVSTAAAMAWALLVPRPAAPSVVPGRPRASWLMGAVAVAAGLLGAWVIGRELPARAFSETLRLGEDGTIAVGPRDGAFLAREWSEVLGDYPVRMRVATGDAAVVIPLPAVADYPVTLRVDPFPVPFAAPPPASPVAPLPTPPSGSPARLPVLDVELNGAPIGAVTLEWTAGRVGAYRLTLPRSAVRLGDNHLQIRIRPGTEPSRADGAGSHPGLADGAAFAFWLLRVHPAQ